MAYYLVIFPNDSLKIYRSEQDPKSLPAGARQFICSSNVTVQDLYAWIADGYKGLNTVREILSSKRT